MNLGQLRRRSLSSEGEEIEHTSERLLTAAVRLHGYISKEHWGENALVGPDPGIRFNARVGRFVKSYFDWLPWDDDLVYMQAQAYWIFANWKAFDLLKAGKYESIAVSCSDFILRQQTDEGCWPYPNPEWSGRVATVEGCFAALALLETYSRTRREKYLEGALRWVNFLFNRIGFRNQSSPDMLAVNYFAHARGDGGGVPNNSTTSSWLLARAAQLTGESEYLTPVTKMLAWLKTVQRKTGELPYSVGGTPSRDRVHFLCYQYNAFEFIALANCYRITNEGDCWSIMQGLARYLSNGLTSNGDARYDCNQVTPNVTYYTMAVGRALSVATDLRLGRYRSNAGLAFSRVLEQQQENGGFRYYSRKNYYCLADRRSYPRYLSMMLYQLFLESEAKTRREVGRANSMAAFGRHERAHG